MSDADLATVRSWIHDARRVVVLTGAGISTDSGIPDFRGPQGLWTRNPEAEKMATIQNSVADPEVRRRAWRNRLETIGRRAQPNAGHLALADLEKRGNLDTLITQNVDGLHHAAGNSPEKIVEIHGTSLDWAFQWYAQEPGGPLYGPFDSLGTGVVRVDTISTDSVHLTQKIQGFVFTFVSVPSRPILFYTGDASQGGGVPDVTVSVEGATLDHELLLFCPFVSWWSIDQSPDSRPQSTAEQLVQRKWYPRRHPIPSHAMTFGSGSLP